MFGRHVLAKGGAGQRQHRRLRVHGDVVQLLAFDLRERGTRVDSTG